MEQGDLFASLEVGVGAANACASNAESKGWDADAAANFVLMWLQSHGPTPGEVLVTEAIGAGHRPHDARAFGVVFLRLKRRGLIESCGYTRRTKGHGTHGGLVWRASGPNSRGVG